MKKDLVKIIFLVAFLLMLTVPLCMTNTMPNKASELEKRKLASFPKVYSDNGEKNLNFLDDFETWFNDNVGLREFLFEANSKLQYDIFNNSAIDKVVVGKDGWLFYNRDNNLEIASNDYPNLSEENLREICNRQIEIKNKLGAQGIEYVFILPPSKVSIYPEYIKGNFGISNTPADILADYLEANSDIKVIRLKEALLKEKENTQELLYFKTDTHWTAYGAYVAYKEIISRLNSWEIINDEPVDVNLIKSSSMRDLTSMIVKQDEKYYENAIANVEIINPTSVKTQEGDFYNYIQNYTREKSISYDGDYYTNINQDMLTFLVFGDSMYMDHIKPLLAENCSALISIWGNRLSQDIIDYIKPDVVFLEITERYIGNLLTASSDYIDVKINLIDNEIMEIVYCDFGEYSNMWFPTWSEVNGQDDLVWYEATRTDSWHWKASVELKSHNAKGNYFIHFYEGEDLVSNTFICGTSYNVGDIQ